MGEAIHGGPHPLPIGRVLAAFEGALILGLPNGQTVQVPPGARLPSGRALLFVGSILLATLQFHVRYREPFVATGSEYTVVEILG